MAQFQLVMHSGPTPGKTFPLDGDVLTIGREAGNNIVINDAEVSRKHCQFVFQGGKYILTDLGSTNGTFINGQRLTGQHILQSGEVISLGEQINLLFEALVVVDPNATMLSSRPIEAAPRPAVAPVSAPPPAPKPISSGYAGQVPAGPEPMAPAPVKSGGSRVPLIVAGVVLFLVVCCCVSALWYIDANFLWCDVTLNMLPGCQ